MRAQSCPILCNPMDCCPPGSSAHGIFQARNPGVVCPFLLQDIFPAQGSNPHLLHLLHWQADSLPLAPPGKPMALEKGLCWENWNRHSLPLLLPSACLHRVSLGPSTYIGLHSRWPLYYDHLHCADCCWVHPFLFLNIFSLFPFSSVQQTYIEHLLYSKHDGKCWLPALPAYALYNIIYMLYIIYII